MNYTLTRSDGAAYHLKADKNTGMVTITDGDGKETSVPMQVEGDQWTFVLGGPENKGLALPEIYFGHCGDSQLFAGRGRTRYFQ